MIDLFRIVVPDDRIHPNLRWLLMPEERYIRDLLNSWTEGFVDRDGKLVEEFQTTFNSSFWELYLHRVFCEFGLTVDYAFPVPDFCIRGHGGISVEAVISNNSVDAPAEHQRDYTTQTFDEGFLEGVVRTATIRLANALISKYRKYQESYSKLSQVRGKPFIIAVAPFEQPFFWEQANRAISQVLYAYKRCVFSIVNAERIIHGHEYLDFIEKDNGAEIPLGFFSHGQMPEVSAVLFSNVATLGKLRALTKDVDPRPMIFAFLKFNRRGLEPHQASVEKDQYSETLDTGLSLFLNPLCDHPLPSEFTNLFEGVTRFDLVHRCPLGDAKDGALIKRMVHVIGARE